MAKKRRDVPIAESHIHKQVRGWCLPYLLGLDLLPGVGSTRWAYWMTICDTLQLPAEPIPQIDFGVSPDNWRAPYPDHMDETPDRHIKRVLDRYVTRYGQWYDDAWLHFVRWLLHGFGRHGLETEVERIPEDVRNFWYTQFNLAYLLSCPIDWSAWILQSGPRWMGNGRAKWSKGTGFFSTPMPVCQMMTMLTLANTDTDTVADTRLLTVLDPCCGTGSMLLPASNYSLRLYGVDIVRDLCLCAELNGWLYAPWLAFVPSSVEAMFQMRTQPLTFAWDTSPTPIRLETDPAKVAATEAYRAGELGQAEFFSLLDGDSVREFQPAYEYA
jgi:hypothetical protein